MTVRRTLRTARGIARHALRAVSKPTLVATTIVLVSGVGVSRADVTDVDACGFRVAHHAITRATPETVWNALASRIGRWWSSDHTFSGDARRLWLEARVGGCLCEQLPDGGGVEHLRVVYVEPGRTLRLRGALGPLQEAGVTGSMTWSVEATPDAGARVTLVYDVGGHYPGGFANIAPAVDRVLGEQLARLVRYVDSERPEPPAK